MSPSIGEPTSPSETSSTVTPSTPPELAGYTEQERAAYDSAVSAYRVFAKRNDRFYAVGETSVAAKEFYQRHSIDWSTAFGDLAQVANSDVRVTGSTRTLSTAPRSIKLGSTDVDVVVIERCLDESGRVVTQGGEVVDQPQFRDPHVYMVRLEMRPGERQWRSGVAEQEGTC